jgi:membrane fusion protein (multidrug efflux system)
MNKPFLILSCLSVLAVTGCGKKSAESAQAPKMPPQEVGVVTVQPQRAEVVTELPGRTSAFRVAEVRPQVSGIILKRLFTEGSEVESGQQLYQIDPATYQAEYDSAQAAVAKAEAAQAVAKLLAQRRSKLVNSSVISKQDYDDSYAALQQAAADVASAKAALETARINLEYTKVMSPISGRIGRSAVTEGALVTAGQAGALSTVQQLDPIYVDVTQSSTQLLRLQRELAAGQLSNLETQEASAKLLLEDGTEYPDAGKLQFSEVSVDPGTGSVTLRAVFPNPRRELLPGMFVRALVTEGINEQALLVPQKGVTRNAKGQAVSLVVTADNHVEPRIVTTSRVIGDQWLVTSGIQAGDRVIVEGLMKAPPGSEVRPVEVTVEAKSETKP